MAKDIIARLIAKTDQFDSGMAKATRSFRQFYSQNLTMTGALENSTKSLIKMGAQYASYGAAAAAAMKVVKDAFLRTEQGIDTYGRMCKQSEAAYNTLLDTLNNGNWSNFFSNLNDAINGAAELYNKLDRLGSIDQNNAAAIAIHERTLAELRNKIKEAQAKGNKDEVTRLQTLVKKQQQELAALQGQSVKAGREAGQTGIVETLRSYYQSQNGAGKIADSSLNKVAKDLLTNGNKAFDRWSEIADRLGKKAELEYDVYGPGGVKGTETKTDWNKLTPQEANQLRMARAVTQSETALKPYVSTYAQAEQRATQLANQDYRYSRQAGLYGSSGSGGRSSNTDYQVQKFDTTSISNDTFLSQYSDLQSKIQQEKEQEALKLGITFEMNEDAKAAIQGIFDSISSMAAEQAPISINISDEELETFKAHAQSAMDALDKQDKVTRVASAASGAASAFANLGSAMASVDEPVFQIAGIIAQAIGELALSFSQSLKTATTPWEWIAAAISGTATLISTIVAVKSATSGFASGGLITGTSFAGDTVPIMANAGEIVLNQAQQENIATGLEARTYSGGGGNSIISGEQIVTVVNAYGRRTGRGEILR